MTSDFVFETIVILLLIFLAGIFLGSYIGGKLREHRMMADFEDGAPFALADRFFYLITTSRMNELMVAEERCRRRDVQKSNFGA